MTSSPRDMLLENLDLIEQIVAAVCRRNGMTAEAIEEFSAELKLRLVDNDYGIIRAFQGRSTFGTYMASVVTRALLDYRIREWGKWYASAAATRLGEVAVELERLLYRDDRTLDEAIAALTARFPEITRRELEELAERLPARFRRRHVGIDPSVMELAAPVVFAADQASVAAEISRTIRDFIQGLSENEQVMLRLRFDAGMPAPQIARALQLVPHVVYRQLHRLFGEMRARLEATGIAAADIEEIIGSDAALDFHLRKGGGEQPAAAGPEQAAVHAGEAS